MIAAVAYYTGGLIANAWAGTTALGSAASSAMIAGGTATSGFAGAAAGMAASSTLSGALMYGAIQGATAGFVGGLLMSGGDLEFALKSGLAGGISGGLTSFGGAAGGWAGRIAGQSLGSGVNARLNGGDFMNGLKYGLMGAMRSEAFQYIKTETDRLASKWWASQGINMDADSHGNAWTYGGRGCESGGGGQCTSGFPFLMGPEAATDKTGTWYDKPIGMELGRMPVVGTFLNAVSKTHDWMNNALTAVYNPNTGGARDFGLEFGARVAYAVDVISAAGMLPAAYITAKSIWQSPLQLGR